MQFLVNPVVYYAANSPELDLNRNRIYTISCIRSGLSITQEADGSIVQRTWTESDNQKWQIISGSKKDHTFIIKSVANGKVIEVPNSSKANSVELKTQSETGGLNQQWYLVDLSNGTYLISSAHCEEYMVMDMKNGWITEGNPIQQYQNNQTDSQKWIISEVVPTTVLFDKKATIYEHAYYDGASQDLGPGQYLMKDLTFGNDKVSSLRVPEGLRVDLFEEDNFRGEKLEVSSDLAYVSNAFNDKTSAVVVEKVVTFFEKENYQGERLILGVGRYTEESLKHLGNNKISSIKVPQGLRITLYTEDKFDGAYLAIDQDIPSLSPYTYDGGDFSFDNNTSSLIIKAVGIIVPNDALNYGNTITLKSYHRRWMAATSNGELLQQYQNEEEAKFTIVRAGDSKHNSLVSYGDIIALKNNVHGKYATSLVSDKKVAANSDQLTDAEKFVIFRGGKSKSDLFVSKDDTIVLKPLKDNHYLTAMPDLQISIYSTVNNIWEQWTVDSSELPPALADTASSCGAAAGLWSVAGLGVCGAAVCGADACGLAACGAAVGGLINICATAATGVAVCGAAVVVGAVAGATICGAAVGGLTACGADACGAAACGAAACGAAACGAAGCGADACGAAAGGVGANLVGACAAETGGVDACTADACAANACGINLCPADACAADACAIDIIPIIPFI